MSLKLTWSGVVKCTCFSVNNQVAEDKCRKMVLSLKMCLNWFKTKKRILLSQFYYKVGKNNGSIFFQSVCEAAILQIAFLYSWADRKNGYLIFLLYKWRKGWCVRKIINDGVESSTRKSQARFQIIHLMLGKASYESRQSENFPEISLSLPQHHYRFC